MENNTCQHISWRTHAKRRKQCVQCGKTQTIRIKKRGRKPKRTSITPLIAYLRGKSVRTSSRDLRRARDLFNRTMDWPDVSMQSSPCFLLADALHIKTPTYQLSVYIILVTTIGEERAQILPVYFGKGGESFENWQKAFMSALPQQLLPFVKALVCDGRGSLLALGKKYGWLIQRCQFHLLARVQSLRSISALSRHRQEGIFLREQIKIVCETSVSPQMTLAITLLKNVVDHETNRHLKTTLSGLIKNHEHYRTYLQYPDLHLAHTTNAVESLNSLIRGLMWKMRGFENEESARAWITALLKERKFIRVCTHRKTV